MRPCRNHSTVLPLLKRRGQPFGDITLALNKGSHFQSPLPLWLPAGRKIRATANGCNRSEPWEDLEDRQVWIFSYQAAGERSMAERTTLQKRPRQEEYVLTEKGGGDCDR